MITCPVNQTVHTDLGQSYGTVNWTEPTTTDNSGQDTTMTCSVESEAHFNIGRTEVICKALDRFGNQAMCSFTIDVRGKKI